MIYTIGLVFVILVILISIDDLIWDIYYFINKLRGKYKKQNIEVYDVESTAPKMLAVLIAAYKEEAVLKEVVQNMVKSSQYPNSMYHIFIGVYPNDPNTQKVADELVEEFPNVHKIVHILNGPSSKADNLNNIIKNMYRFEKINNIEFQAIIIHDSEDLIHPYEFKVENYLLEKHHAIQMPVFPLQKEVKFNNLFENIVSGTYAGEFAENHYRMLVARTLTGAFVPSAGTGFVIRRDVLEQFPDENVFPVGSLTEDYRLSLQIKEMGYDIHYVLEDVQKLSPEGKIAKEFVSTRSMFPSSYSAAVRQKTRWIYGITMESFSLKEILQSKNLNFQSKYSLYRDWKAKYGNLLIIPGYLIFAYFIFSLFFPLPTIYPKHTLSWYLMVFLSIMMLERQILRFTSIQKVYGTKYAIASVLLPPILPVKMVAGNIINFHATVRAWLTRFSINLNRNKKKKKKVKWSKTDHDFLEEEVLKRFRRTLGDTLLYKKYISESELEKAIKISKSEKKELVRVLIDYKFVEEDAVIKSICEIEQKRYIALKPGRFLDEYVEKYGVKKLMDIMAIPLIKHKDELTVMTTLGSDKKIIQEVLEEPNISYIYTTKTRLEVALEHTESLHLFENEMDMVEEYIRDGYIDVEQGLIALDYKKKDEKIEETLHRMGLLKYS